MRRLLTSVLPVAAIVAAAIPSTSTAQPSVPEVDLQAVPVERAGLVAGEEAEAWRARRTELGLGALGVAEPTIAPSAVADAIERLHEAGLLGPERVLLAELQGAGQLDAGEADRWDAVLRDVDAGRLDRADLVRRVLHISLGRRGSLAAALPLDCLPVSPDEELAALLQAEARTPWWRPRAPTEPAPESASARYALLTEAIALLGSSPPPPAAGGGASDACGDGVPALLAALAHASRDEFAAVTPALLAVAATRSLDPRLLVRPAVAAYVRADAAALSTLAALLGSTREGAYVAALRSAMSDDPAQPAAALTALPPAGNAVEYWVRGELARRAGRWDEALEALESAIGLDPLLAPALLSRCSALIAAGRASDALPDLHHLQLTYPGDSPYATLIDALERRLR